MIFFQFFTQALIPDRIPYSYTSSCFRKIRTALTGHIIHVLLHSWVCLNPTSDFQSQSGPFIPILYDALFFDMQRIRPFIEEAITSAGRDFGERLMDRIIHTLDEERCLGEDANMFLFAFSLLIGCDGNNIMPSIRLPDVDAILPSFVLCFQRQLCSTAPDNVRSISITFPMNLR